VIPYKCAKLTTSDKNDAINKDIKITKESLVRYNANYVHKYNLIIKNMILKY